MTPADASRLFSMLQVAAFEPKAAIVESPRDAAKVYAAAFTAAGATLAEMEAAVASWVQSDCPFWPTPGQLLARTPAARLAAQLATPAEVDRAWSDFERRFHHLACFDGPVRENPERQWDPDPHRNEAMWDAYLATGGRRAFAERSLDDRGYPARWRTIYADARKRQAEHPPTVRAMLGGPTSRRLLLGGDS